MKKITLLLLISVFAAFAAACGSGTTSTTGDTAAGKTVKSGPAGNNLTATLSSKDGVLRKGKQDFTLTFTDAAGKPVDVGSVSLNFHMPAMGTMAVMNNPATFTTTSTPGVYAGKTDLEMSGEWQAQIKYEGPAGNGSANLPIVAQ
ncbi:MAG: FixH family protein [Acidobacteria bacterium]|jgi:nitrogen fixation protein FixH|nr:FixH family protein [Acidobacteriota bacterium]